MKPVQTRARAKAMRYDVADAVGGLVVGLVGIALILLARGAG